MKTLWKVIISIVVIGAVVLIVWYFSKNSDDGTHEVETMTIETMDLSEEVITYGTINPDRTIYLNSTRGDIVEEIPKKEGDGVLVDDVLVKFNNGTELKSPIDGVVLENNAIIDQDMSMISSQASLTASTSALVAVGDFDPLVINAEIDESDIILVEQGQWVRIYPDAYPDLVLEGEIREIGMSPVVRQSETATLYPVRIEITDAKGMYPRDGLTADVDIIISTTEHTITLPVEAAVKENGNYFVFILDENIVKKQNVELGFETEDYFEVLGGLNNGVEVIVTKTGELKDGDKVIIEN